MENSVVKVTLKSSCKRKIERSFSVDLKISAEEFAVGCLSTFNVAFEHMFLFSDTKNKLKIEDRSWVEEYPGESLPYDCFTLCGLFQFLGERFILEYDTGEGYEFEVKLMKSKKPSLGECKIQLIKGQGYGIFEDAHYVLERFLQGESLQKVMKNLYYGSDEDVEEDIEEDVGVPFMCELDINATIDDYFAPLDIEGLQEKLESDLMIMFN